MDLRESLDRPVSAYASAGYVKVSFNDSVVKAASAMRKDLTTEAVVVNIKGPAGIVTERDILFKVVAEGLDPGKTSIGSVMSAPIETVDGKTSVGEAIAKMSKLGVRRLGVTKDGKFVGLVTQKNLVAGDLGRHVALPELAEPDALRCPYCGFSAREGKELSKHIDRVHLGMGLLEGNLTRW